MSQYFVLPEYFIPFIIPLPLIIVLYKIKVIGPRNPPKIPFTSNINLDEIIWIFGPILSFSFLFINLLEYITYHFSFGVFLIPLLFTIAYILSLEKSTSNLDRNRMTEGFILSSWLMGIIPLRQFSASALVVQIMLYPLIQIFTVLVLYWIFCDTFESNT